MQINQFKTINFSCEQIEIENFSGSFDSNRLLGDIKIEIINRKYIPFQIEFYQSNKKKLLDNQTLGDLPYDTLNITIRKGDNLQGQLFLKSYLQQNRERSKEISVLLITNFQSKGLNDEFKMFKSSLINFYYNYDVKPMKFTDLYNNLQLEEHQFVSYKDYQKQIDQQFKYTNNPEMLNIVLAKIFNINWKTVYKVVIIFTDSKHCSITQHAINLFRNGYQVIFITNNDENQKWIENQSNAYPVLCSNNIDFYGPEFIQIIKKQINQTLQQIITPLSKTTIKVINEDFTKFDLMQSFVKINLQEFQDFDDNQVIEETMDYFIPKLEYRSIDEIISDIRKFKIKFVKHGIRKVKYSKSPIGEGVCKTVYGCIIENKNYVLKMRKQTQGFKSEADIEEDIKNHLLTQEIFDNFSIQLQQKGEKIPAQFGDVFVLRNNQGRYFIIEERYSGTDIRFNSNGGFVNDSQDHFNKIAQAFSIFSFIFSKKNFIILDLQGYVNSNNSFVYFSDPAVVTFQNNFSNTDLGVAYTDQYLAQWDSKQQIGREYLQKLGIY